MIPLAFVYSAWEIFIESEHDLPMFFGVLTTLWSNPAEVSFFESEKSAFLVLKMMYTMNFPPVLSDIESFDFYIDMYCHAFSPFVIYYTINTKNVNGGGVLIYFDACATGGKKDDSVISATLEHFENIANAGRSGHKLATQNGILLADFRNLIAESFKISNPSRIVVTKNCSEGLNLGILGTIRGLKKRRGEVPHVITSALEHNSVLRPLFHLRSKGEISLTVCEPSTLGGVELSVVKNAMKKSTRLVCLNLVSNVTGGRSEVEKVGEYLKNTDVILLCDGAQGLGHFDFSAENIDILCAPMHKALGGVMGVGFASFSEKVTPLPIAFGGNGVNSSSLSQGVDFPESFEVGTMNMLGICGSFAGLKHKMAHMKESVKKVAELDSHLRSFKFDNLKEYSVPNECGIFSFLACGLDSAEIANYLNEKHDIACRGGLTCAPLCHKFLGTTKTGVCRISFDEYNTHEEIEILAKAILDINKTAY